MRILQLIDAPRRRGAEVFARQLNDGLRGCGHDVRLLAIRSSNDGSDTLDVDQTIGSWDGRGVSISVAQKVAQAVAAFSADIVQANGGSTPKCAALAKLLRPSMRWQLVYRNIGDPSFWISSPLQRAFYRRVVWPRFDGVVSVSRQAAEGLRAVYGRSGPAIEVIYQGVDKEQLRPSDPRSEVRQRLETGDDTVVVVWVGALSTEKRPDRALRVMSKMKSLAEPVVLWVVGAGPMGDELVAVAQELGVADRVRWIGAVEDVGTYLHAADVFLLTSDTEGVPGALLEAMTVGLPSVVTDVGGVSEVMDDGRTGFLIPSDDEPAMVDRLSRLTADATLRGRVGDDARIAASQRYEMDTCVENYEAFYRSILNSQAAS